MTSYIERPRYLCSLGGAFLTLTALPGTIPILHAASGCAGNITWAQNGGSGLQAGGYCGGLSVPSSNVQEKEVVFGGGDRLREQIKNTFDVMEGKLFVVTTGCVTEIIGDDVKAVVNEFRQEGLPIIAAETGGFKGNSYDGYDIVMQALTRDYIKPSQTKGKGKVNIFGIVPYMDVFWRGNLEGIRQVLTRLGLEVNTFFTPDDTSESLAQAANAELNIVVSESYGIETAKAFEEIHGIPYIVTGLPVGPSATDKLIRDVAKVLSLDAEQAEKIITEENRRYYQYIDSLIECYTDLDLQKYAVVIGDLNYAPALTRFLADDLGWLPELVVYTDQIEEDRKEYFAGLTDHLESGLKPHVIFETTTSRVIEHLNRLYPKIGSNKYMKGFSPAFVVGSSLDRELAQAINVPHLSIGFPVANRAVLDRGYTGYRGGLRLAEDLLSAAVVMR
ncbi:oxidoreductase/nitrogenase component 1 [Syntrophobotulus glycolicus DSM 8271]|uniref:Oxidoreductase/nitrogenase component 1 n=1 Tax=Syntrophobotulus glycolicus (strain DSM 8271 / FlGlyR) TaxID=645991 RepID=F0SYE5_SYNGF|nr:nitrogenase component 1 [Syntrophobotulus glycolicus]ADY57057.1 oxidoreductase/nitrogenase component 1 [Syntrophobotulus glycolicus DSM 8271]